MRLCSHKGNLTLLSRSKIFWSIELAFWAIFGLTDQLASQESHQPKLMDDFRWKDWQMETSLASCQIYADNDKLFARISLYSIHRSQSPKVQGAPLQMLNVLFEIFRLWGQETLKILALVLPIFSNLFNYWSASAFSSACRWRESLPELRSQSNCLQCSHRSLWKRSYPCVFRWPQPQSTSSCSLNGFICYILGLLSSIWWQMNSSIL